METWRQRIFLALRLATSATVRSATVLRATVLSVTVVSATASAQQAPVRIEPQIQRSVVNEAKLDDESAFISLQGGLISLNDFGSSGLVKGQLGYQITEDFYVSLDYAKAKAGLTSFEKLSGAAPLMTDAQRQWTYTGANVGYVLMPGEVYFGSSTAMNSRWSVTLGGGNLDFAGDKVFAIAAGTAYQIYLTDYLAADIQISDHMYETTILAETKTQHSLALSLGLSFYF